MCNTIVFYAEMMGGIYLHWALKQDESSFVQAVVKEINRHVDKKLGIQVFHCTKKCGHCAISVDNVPQV